MPDRSRQLEDLPYIVVGSTEARCPVFRWTIYRPFVGGGGRGELCLLGLYKGVGGLSTQDCGDNKEGYGKRPSNNM